MHLLFTQVHFSSDISAESEVNMLEAERQNIETVSNNWTQSPSLQEELANHNSAEDVKNLLSQSSFSDKVLGIKFAHRLIGLVGRVFVNGPEDLGSIPGRVIPKTFKMVLDTALLNTQQYLVRIKGKSGAIQGKE